MHGNTFACSLLADNTCRWHKVAFRFLVRSRANYPRRACAARVRHCVCVCVCVTLHLTSRMFVRLTKDTTYLTGHEGQKFRTVFSETVPLQS